MTNNKIKLQIDNVEIVNTNDENTKTLRLTILKGYCLTENNVGNLGNNFWNVGKIEITHSKKEILRASSLINFRCKIDFPDDGTETNRPIIFLKDVNTKNITLDNPIILSNDDFQGGFGINRIIIGAGSANPDNDGHFNVKNDLEDYLTAWKRFNNIYEKQYNNVIGSVTELETDIGFLNNYLVKRADNNSIEKRIYDYLSGEINKGIALLSELKIWKLWGFNTFQEVNNAKKNGFRIGKDHTIGTGKLVEKMPDGASENTESTANINTIKGLVKDKKKAGFRLDDASVSVVPSFKQLEQFSGNDWFGKKNNNINYPARMNGGDPSETRGFKPSDIGENGKYGDRLENMNSNFLSGKKITKIALDILGAPSLDAAIDLAFFGQHYIADNLKDERYQDGPESLLYFNEIEEMNERDTLDFYYQVLISSNCGDNAAGTYDKNTNKLSENGPDWKVNNYENQQSNRQLIDKKYQIIGDFLDLYIKARGDRNKIKELEKYNCSGNTSANADEGIKKRIYEYWKNKIDELEQDSSNNYETKRQSMLSTWTNDPYKKVLKSSEIENETDIQILTELEILFKLLEGAYKTPPTTKKYQLTAYISLTDNEVDNKKKIRKKLWDIIQAQKVGNSTMAWGDEAISKGQVENIEDVRRKIQGKMNKVGSDAYDKIVKNNNKIKDDVEKLIQVEEIWDASVEAWKESKTNNSLFNKLNDFEKDTSKKDVWEAVDSYKKRWEKDKWVDSTEGFALGALNHIKTALNVSKKFDDIYNKADDADKLDTQLQDYINSNEFKKLDSAQQARFKDIIKPRKVAAKRIDIKSSKSSDETELVRLLKLDDLSANYEDSKEGLTEIEKDLKFLNEIKGSSSGDKFNARKAMGDNDADNKGVLTILIDEMTEKLNYLKTKQQDSTNYQDGGGKKDDNLLKNPWFIIPAIIILVILGLVVHLIKSKRKDEEENLIV